MRYLVSALCLAIAMQSSTPVLATPTTDAPGCSAMVVSVELQEIVTATCKFRATGDWAVFAGTGYGLVLYGSWQFKAGIYGVGECLDPPVCGDGGPVTPGTLYTCYVTLIWVIGAHRVTCASY